MPSLTALAGRAGDWDRAFMSTAKLRRGSLLGLCTSPKQPAGQGKQATPGVNVNENITPAMGEKV